MVLRVSAITGVDCISFLYSYGLFLSTAECGFESPNICGFTQDLGDIFDWSRGSGNTTSIKTGPPYDHTYGTSFGKSSFVKAKVRMLYLYLVAY